MNIVCFPDPVLFKKAARVEVVDDAVRAKVEEMRPLLRMERGLGLAAPQVGWSVRVLLAAPDGDADGAIALVNPEITAKSGSASGEEGCLSFPGIYGEVLRATRIHVRATDLDGKPLEFDAEDLYARVIQHEIDHLDGILFWTRMRPADQTVNRRKLEDLRRRYELRAKSGST